MFRSIFDRDCIFHSIYGASVVLLFSHSGRTSVGNTCPLAEFVVLVTDASVSVAVNLSNGDV